MSLYVDASAVTAVSDKIKSRLIFVFRQLKPQIVLLLKSPRCTGLVF